MPARQALETQAKLVESLIGMPCSQTSLGMADALIMDFGELQAGLDGDMAGAIVFVVECPWRIDNPDRPTVGWEDEEEDIAHLSTVLIGGTVEDVDVRTPGYDLNVQFSNGFRLRVFPDCRAYYSEELSGGALPWQLAGRELPAIEGLVDPDESFPG